jgi:putative sterol carrier protein
MIAHGRAASKAPGTYLLDVSDGIGPITVTVQDGRASLTQDRASHPVVTLRMNADQYARFIVGRLDLQRAMDGGKVQVEGDADRAMDLKRIFGGIANGD